MFQYVVYDVFTDKAFGGNQLAVFPDARAIPEDKLQSITAEFNFSEVTFVYPPEDPAHTARVRIFTPTSEVDFAGHPTIGTLIALYDRGQTSPMVLELGIGPLSCTVSEAGAAFTTSQPLQLSSNPAVTLVADVLGVSRDAIKTATHAPVVGSLGIPFVLVELTNETALSACEPNVAAMREGFARHPDSHDFAIFAYVKSGKECLGDPCGAFDPAFKHPAEPDFHARRRYGAALKDNGANNNKSIDCHNRRPSREDHVRRVYSLKRSNKNPAQSLAGFNYLVSAAPYLFSNLKTTLALFAFNLFR